MRYAITGNKSNFPALSQIFKMDDSDTEEIEVTAAEVIEKLEEVIFSDIQHIFIKFLKKKLYIYSSSCINSCGHSCV